MRDEWCSYNNGATINSMILFEWDEVKATQNFRKHGISFELARLVFSDPYALVEQDRIEDGWPRWRTIGLVSGVVVLFVAHTVEDLYQDEVIRIISARRATQKERIRYEQNRKKYIG
jgi:uncharacterized DUF497 family protein